MTSEWVKRISSTIDNTTLQSYAGFLNLLASSISLHSFNTFFDLEIIAKAMNVPQRNVDVAAQTICGFLTNIAKKYKGPELTFNSALRQMLIDSNCYENLPTNVVDGLVMTITISCSEAIAETQGSIIDSLHLRYKNTDKDDTSLQNELKVRLMGPEPCTTEGEKLVNVVAKRMADKHSFVKANNTKMGSAITNVISKGYSLPFKF